MRVFKDICYGSSLLDLYLPEGDSFKLLLYFHGGGLESGDKDDRETEGIAKHLCHRGIGFASANYRMYPKASYPDFLEDAAEAVAWTVKNIGSYGKCAGVFVGGSSAGGYLSMMLCFNGELLGKHGLSPTDIKGYIHDAGQPTAHFNVLRERGMDTRRVIVDGSAPLYYVGEAKKYSPMLFIVADSDIPARYEQTLLIKAALDSFGHKDAAEVKVMRGNHVSYLFEKDESGDNLFASVVADFILKVEY